MVSSLSSCLGQEPYGLYFLLVQHGAWHGAVIENMTVHG